VTQDIQAELRMIREMLSWLRNEERFREEILGVSPSGPGQSGQAPEPASRLGHSETVPNAFAVERAAQASGNYSDEEWWTLTNSADELDKCTVTSARAIARSILTQISIPLRGRIA
jgi:hypothetical protein